MRINHNIMAINNYRQLTNNTNQAGKSLEKLSSGQKINRAGDNAAGLAISEKMRGQIRGLDQAGANAQDGISLIKTAEGALSETHSLVQRIRELSVQAANDTNVAVDREAIQSEIDQLTKEVDRIGNTTEFNTKKLLNQGNASVSVADQQNLMSSLKKWWLDEAEQLVFDSYGISASGINMTVEFVNDSSSSYAAMVEAGYAATGGDAHGDPNITGKAATDLNLKINLAYAQPTDTMDGGTYYQYVDRVIAHEITHAVMASTMNMGDLSSWFIEGVAEFTHGGDDRLKSSITALGGGDNDAGVAAVVSQITAGRFEDWGAGNSHDYSAAYLAVRYLDKATGGDVDAILQYLATPANATKNLDDALANEGTFANTAAWLNSFKSDVTNMATLLSETGVVLNFGSAETDTGSATGLDAAGGAAETAESIMPEAAGAGAAEVDQPMSGFNIIWPDLTDSAAQSFTIQVGANTGQSMAVSTSDMRASALGIDALDVSSYSKANDAIAACDSAISMVSAERSRLGAYQNRLEHTIKNLQTSSENLTSSESRIRDVDMAREMMAFTKNNILSQAAQAMLSQANQQPQGVLQLLA
ncbi:flagellinolysin [Acetobacterium wieringae]|uniref:flagellinolysin n=1 Tax=Acetobacterium wieringae TaxID=52694 RepID=UPI0026EA958C|nr:flagellinolysin [Acetobacterium wieringae]